MTGGLLNRLVVIFLLVVALFFVSQHPDAIGNLIQMFVDTAQAFATAIAKAIPSGRG